MTEDQIKAVKIALDYILLITELSIIRDGKHEAVKKQDFEEAAKYRELETVCMTKIPSLEEVKQIREKIIQ